ncbi:MAG: 50S ribosomal protein L25 [Candidatus Omnitrophica bacterium]|nr:50S ribosomal protein L25 [Candidatus Omnitrophota bacterium]
MAVYDLAASLRDLAGKGPAKKMRREGRIPCVVYSKDHEAVGLSVDTREFQRALRTEAGENVIIELAYPESGKSKKHNVLVKEIQEHPVSGGILHVDFVGIDLKEKIQVSVPVAIKGAAVGVKRDGGVMEHVMWEIEVECLPTAIPSEIQVNVSELGMNEALHVKDLKMPEGVESLEDADAVVVTVVPPRAEEAAAPLEEGEELQQPEVIGEKKEDEEAASEKE